MYDFKIIKRPSPQCAGADACAAACACAGAGANDLIVKLYITKQVNKGPK